MASSQYSKSPTIKRILREAAELAQSPSPDFYAAPASDSDIFDWHFTIRGPPSSAFANGIYHGRIILPPTYPLRPPSFRFLNSSGRFEVNREICLSISGHHEETWMPAWGVRTALTALRSFMETDPKGQLGGMECTTTERERFARESVGWVCSVCNKKNEDILKECQRVPQKPWSDKNLTENEDITSKLEISSRDTSAEKNEKETSVTTFEQTGILDSKSKPEHDTPANEGPLAVQNPSSSSEISSQKTAPKVNQPRQAITARVEDRNSPLWIDSAIATVIICLVAMILKVILRF